ncbi:MAG: hypothetical protein ACOCUW_00665 [Gemmatimonadota bacterium]
MTDGHPHPEEELTPPTSTRRDQGAEEADDELAPPFVPGRAGRAETGAPVEEAAPRSEDPVASPAPDPDEAFPFEAGWEDADEELAGDEDDFPFEAFDIEGDPATADQARGADADAYQDAGYAEETFEEDLYGTEPFDAAGPGSTAADLAARLETMARRLREGGAGAVQAELDAPDRFTALLAGLVAGYLAGRD